VEGRPSNPPPSIEEGRQAVKRSQNISDNYGAIGSSPTEGNEKEKGSLGDKAKNMAGNLGSMFKKGWGFVAKGTKETAQKVGESKIGQSVKTGFGVAVDKSKVIGGVIVDKTVMIGGKVKDGVVIGFVRRV
jgi:hypothetical protein